MNFRNISAWSIKNPVPPIVLFVALLLGGIMAFNRLPISQDPDIDFPVAIVSVVQPGAAPSELETQVAQKIEAAVRGVSGVDEINSTVREGSATIVIFFKIGTPIDRAVNDVRDAVSNVRSDLPDGILEPQVLREDTAGNAIAYISAEAVDMTLEELSWYVDNTVSKKLRALPGSGAVERGGGVSREIRIILDPAKMQSFGLTASQVNNQLRQTNVNTAGGRTEIAGSEQSIRVLGNAKNAHELGETQISLGGGRAVKLTNIADVRDLYAEQRSLSTMDGRQVLSFSITRAKGASDVMVYDQAMAELRKMEAANPKVKFRDLFTSVNYSREQYTSSMAAMIEGAILAVIVVFLFLRDWRATLISAIAIPLSAIPTFWFMEWMGFSLNQISLLALGLVAGVLVDDAIVEIENIVRHMRMGKSAYQASIDAADEIGLAVLATTMAIVAVFLPVGVMPGIPGQFFKNFGLTVVAAVLLSLAVARLITPMVAAYFLKSHGIAEHAGGKWMVKYLELLKWSLHNRGKTLALGGVSLLLTIGTFSTLPFTFFPDIDQDYSQIRIEMVPGSTLTQTRTVAEHVQKMVMAEKGVVDAAFADINPGSSTIYLTLKENRTMSSLDFEEKWGPALGAIPDARVNFRAQDSGGPPGSGRDIQITLAGDDPEVLSATANKLVEGMRSLPELVAPRVNGDLQRPEILIKPRMDLAANLGVTTSALSQTIRIATIGDIDQNSPKFSLSDRQVPIRVTLSEDSKRSLSTIENLPVPTASGGTVPLKSVAQISFGAGPTAIQRTNLNRRTSVGADLAEGIVSSIANKKIDDLPIMKNLPQGVTRLSTGQSKMQAEMLTNFVIALVSGVFLVFAVLLLLYRRIMPPFVNMGSLLLAPLGAAIALWMTGMPVSMPVLIGMLMLLGIVAKNSILVVDFALEEMGRGVDKYTAIMEAGHKRAQPIVMTTVAMVAGMIPTAVALSGDGAWRQPMGITVIGGLIVSTILTLLIVPATFSLALGFEERVGPWLSYWLTNGGDEDHPVKPPSLFPERFRQRFAKRFGRPAVTIQPAE
ncbi:MAG: efflux RND transporter permease subunit [Chakrabartia sp.]